MMLEKKRPEAPTRVRNGYSEEQAREIGRRLREARLAQRLDVAALAACTFTQVGDLEALEQGEFDRVAGRIHLPVFLRVYGDHLRLDGEALAGARAAPVDQVAAGPEPTSSKRAGGAGRQVLAVLVVALGLGAAGAGYQVYRPGPGTAETIPGAAPPVAAANPHGGTEGSERVLAPARAPAPASATMVSVAVPRGSEPTARGAAEPEPAVRASPGTVEPETAAVVGMGQGEPSSRGPGASAGGPQVLEVADTPDDELSTSESVSEAGGPSASEDVPEGGSTGATRQAVPVRVDPGLIGPSLGATVSAVEELAAWDEPVPPAATAEPSSLSPVPGEAAAGAGAFAVYFFSVRPAAQIARAWQRLTARYPELASLDLRPTRPVTIPGKGTFYAIEAGAFASRGEAQAVCDRVRARGQSCKVLAP